MRRFAAVVAVLPAALALIGCAAPELEFADWAMPVAEGVPVREYAAVPAAERTEQVELVVDLEIGERPGDDNYTLYDAYRVLAGPDGRIYVLDSGNSRVQVFDENGEHLTSMGREGQGPGEFSGVNDMAIVGDRLMVRDFRARRYSLWTLDGEHVEDVAYPAGPAPLALHGFDDGTFVGRITVRLDEGNPFDSFGTPDYELVRYALDASVVHQIADLPRQNLPTIQRLSGGGGSVMRMSVPSPNPTYATTPGGLVYLALGEEYQVYALDREGAMRWALRTNWERAPITEQEIDAALERARERIPDASRSEVDWPAARPALLAVRVDGHGHVYVLPYPATAEEAEDEVATVDVYDADGQHLFSGTMPDVGWTDARGDFVYMRAANENTGEERVIRYRLVEPWAPS